MKFVFAILLPLLIYSLSYFAPRGKIGEFDHFWFVLTWPPSFCEVNECISPAPPNFTIHGLWPTDKDGNTLHTPKQRRANLSFVLDNDTSPLVQDLNEYWPNFMIDNINKCFWKHEWDKHGRTISKWNEQELVTPEVYFDRAVKLIKNISINISSALNETGMVSDFVSAIAKVTGLGTVMLNCTGTDDNKVLAEVRLCVNRNATEPFKICSGEKEQKMTQKSCGEGKIRFPGGR